MNREPLHNCQLFITLPLPLAGSISLTENVRKAPGNLLVFLCELRVIIFGGVYRVWMQKNLLPGSHYQNIERVMKGA